MCVYKRWIICFKVVYWGYLGTIFSTWKGNGWSSFFGWSTAAAGTKKIYNNKKGRGEGQDGKRHSGWCNTKTQTTRHGQHGIQRLGLKMKDHTDSNHSIIHHSRRRHEKKYIIIKKEEGRSRRGRDTGQHNDANNNEATGSNGIQRWGVKAHDGFEPVNKK